MAGVFGYWTAFSLSNICNSKSRQQWRLLLLWVVSRRLVAGDGFFDAVDDLDLGGWLDPANGVEGDEACDFLLA
jgi:hypothetical protein